MLWPQATLIYISSAVNADSSSCIKQRFHSHFAHMYTFLEEQLTWEWSRRREPSISTKTPGHIFGDETMEPFFWRMGSTLVAILFKRKFYLQLQFSFVIQEPPYISDYLHVSYNFNIVEKHVEYTFYDFDFPTFSMSTNKAIQILQNQTWQNTRIYYCKHVHSPKSLGNFIS